MAIKRKRKVAPLRKAAVTADIVNATNRPPVRFRVPRKWIQHYAHLIETRNYLLNRQGDLVKDAREEATAFSLHMADAGTDSFDRDFALSRASSEQDAVYEIDEALDRIRDGTYGICELTGKHIEPARLEAIPWTRFSLKAEQMLERDGALPKARLAPREAVPRGASGLDAEEPTGGEQSEHE